jgi:hypothetical protein
MEDIEYEKYAEMNFHGVDYLIKVIGTTDQNLYLEVE